MLLWGIGLTQNQSIRVNTNLLTTCFTLGIGLPQNQSIRVNTILLKTDVTFHFASHIRWCKSAYMLEINSQISRTICLERPQNCKNYADIGLFRFREYAW
jgi:hypothetical protein